MFRLFLASSIACLHKPVLRGLRKCSLPSSGCDGAALGVVFKQTLCPGLGSFIPVMWQECYLSEEIISTGACLEPLRWGIWNMRMLSFYGAGEREQCKDHPSRW